jgi:hypothetical protein
LVSKLLRIKAELKKYTISHNANCARRSISIITGSSPPLIYQGQNMTINGKLFTRFGLIAVVSSLAAACVAVVPAPNNDKAAENSSTSATMCNIEGKQEQDLSDGSTKAKVTQSCEETVIYIENQHKEHPKRCRVLVGAQMTELYIMPGENRTLSQTGPVPRNTVQVGCVNDWNRTK